MNKFLNGNRFYSLVFFLVLIFLFILLIPILFIAKYNVPSADDFSFSCETHAAVMNGECITGIISGACSKVQDVYFSWQGTFAAVFFMALQPSIWGFSYYSLTTWIMLVSLLGGIFLLCYRLFSGIFQIQKSVSGIIASVISTACIQFVPFANQSFYWYNGSVYYTFTFGVMLIMYAAIIGFILYGGAWRIILLSALNIIIGGSNYVTALLSFIISLSIILILIFRKDKKWIILLIPFIIFLLSFAISILAPGNAVRQEDRPDHPGAIQAILLSFRYSSVNLFSWADLRFLACILFLIPFLYHAAASCQFFSFPAPLLVSIFSYCLYSSAFTPHLYALASDGPDRLKNIIYFFLVFLTVINLFWWCGWISRRFDRQNKSCTSFAYFFPYLLFTAGALLSIVCAIFISHESLTSVLALNELRSGEAKAYYEEAFERQKALEDPSVPDCEFEPFKNMPYLLFFTDMTDDPTDFQNEDTCTYYGKNSIIVR